MNVSDVRERYLRYMERQGHASIPSSLLVPENDATTLFTSSGMQPLLPYLLGASHPEGVRLTNSQKSFRAEDIEEVGDNRHTTFFEMLGNWSLGDYGKREQLRWFFSFLTEELGLDPHKLYVTVFAGSEVANVAKDDESIAIWKELFSEKGIDAHDVVIGSEARGHEVGMQGGRIFAYDAKKNWWSRAGIPEKMPVGEPGGPDSEVFYDFGLPHDASYGAECHVNCDCGRFIELGNSVFMQFLKLDDGSFAPLPKKNVDFGGGLERITAATLNNPDVFLVDAFTPLREALERYSGKQYGMKEHVRAFRVVLDHLRAAVFMIEDGVLPSNKEAGYVLRRLVRRAVRFADTLGVPEGTFGMLASHVISAYGGFYTSLHEKEKNIIAVLAEEEERFRKTLARGMKELDRLLGASISGRDAFVLFSTYGFPIELTEELARERGVSVDREGFAQELALHQEGSRAGAEHKFKGGLGDQSEKTTMLHTVTHIMLAGLRKYLGEHVHQAGSNITHERARFDFTHKEKVSEEILKKVEEYVNEAIRKECDVRVESMDKHEAERRGVEGSFWEKYPDVVDVYTVVAPDGTVYSRELCGGPHVKNTREIQGTFSIQKEEASSAGVRRVKAILQ